jgi:hypothetical protein
MDTRIIKIDEYFLKSGILYKIVDIGNDIYYYEVKTLNTARLRHTLDTYKTAPCILLDYCYYN